MHSAWIQKADTSIEEIIPCNSADIIKAINAFDWKAEREKRWELGMDNSVDPSFGLGDWDDEHYANIIPVDDNNFSILYRKTETFQKKLLGVFSKTIKNGQNFDADNLKQEQIEAIIVSYCAGNESDILKYIK